MTPKIHTLSTITKIGQSFDVNWHVVHHSLKSGGGYEGLLSFCSIMNMPCLSESANYKQVNTILEALEAEAEDEMRSVGQKLRPHILEENGELNSDNILDAAASLKGNWAKRKFRSLSGVVFAIAVDTGKVLNYPVLSKECRKCSLKKSQCQSDEEFEEWQTEHLASNKCNVNFNGSSSAIEAEGAFVLWSRSIQQHSLRYRRMVSDGNS